MILIQIEKIKDAILRFNISGGKDSKIDRHRVTYKNSDEDWLFTSMAVECANLISFTDVNGSTLYVDIDDIQNVVVGSKDSEE